MVAIDSNYVVIDLSVISGPSHMDKREIFANGGNDYM